MTATTPPLETPRMIHLIWFLLGALCGMTALALFVSIREEVRRDR